MMKIGQQNSMWWYWPHPSNKSCGYNKLGQHIDFNELNLQTCIFWVERRTSGSKKELLEWVCVKVAQSSLTLCDPMDYTVHGILQARILKWVAFPFSRRSSQPRDQTQVSPTAGRFFTRWAPREVGRKDYKEKWWVPGGITLLQLTILEATYILNRVSLGQIKSLL